MLRRCHHTRPDKFKLAPSKVARVVRDQMLRAASNCQFHTLTAMGVGEGKNRAAFPLMGAPSFSSTCIMSSHTLRFSVRA